VYTRAQLLDHVWESSSEWQNEATVTEHIRRIRTKIEVDSDNPRWIATVRGVGYRFEPQ
jgi:DNA-binding response OmpR family regulator